MALKAGDKAPAFTLYDSERKQRSLSEFLGKKTVLAFFPGAFTGVCTKEMCAIRDSLAEFNSMGAQVVGISVDAPAALQAFKDINKLAFPLLTDYQRVVSKQYSGIHESFGNVPGLTTAKRSVFILDGNGVVKYAWITENPGVEPDYSEVKKALASF